MGREKRGYKRPSNKRDADLIVIISEGEETEPQYFEAIKANFEAKNVHVEIIENKSGNSPKHLINDIKKFKRKYIWEKEDQLWIVFDRDRWDLSHIKEVAKQVHQDKHLNLALSNPCFEIWLLFHHKSLNDYDDEEREKIKVNAKISSSRRYLEQLLKEELRSYNKSNLDMSKFLPKVSTAIKNSIDSDLKPKSRWPDYIGTRVYRLVQEILGSSIQ